MKPKKKSNVVTIDSALHEELRKYCEQNGLKIGFLATQALRNMLDGRYATTQSNVPPLPPAANE
jgi:hypothetical protein